MATSSVSDRARQVLIDGGWEPNRSVETAGFGKAMETEGLTLVPSAAAFLEEFGGLAFSFELKNQTGPIKKYFHFHADVAVENWGGEVVNEWSGRIGARTSLLGETDFGASALIMDEAGKVYAASFEALAQIGESGADALDALCTGRRPLRVFPPAP